MNNLKLKATELNRTSVIEHKTNNKNNIFIVLDNIRSAQNVGSFFRTCDAFNVEKIFLCGITATPPNKEILKTALGSTETVEWEFFENTINCIEHLKAEDTIISCIEQTQKSLMLNNYSPNFDKKICLVFGNEVEGVGQEIIDMADECIEIPQFGTKHSLNVSVAGGIVIWDIVSKILHKK